MAGEARRTECRSPSSAIRWTALVASGGGCRSVHPKSATVATAGCGGAPVTQDHRLGNSDDAGATTRPGDRQYQAPSALDDGRAVPSSEERNRSDALGSVGRRRRAILAVARTTAAALVTGIRGRRPARLPRRPAGATVCHARRRFAQAPPGRGRSARRSWRTPRTPQRHRCEPGVRSSSRSSSASMWVINAAASRMPTPSSTSRHAISSSSRSSNASARSGSGPPTLIRRRYKPPGSAHRPAARAPEAIALLAVAELPQVVARARASSIQTRGAAPDGASPMRPGICRPLTLR